MPDPIANAIDNYHDLNAAVVDELQGEPSPLHFMRYVAKNRPFVARRAADEWKAVQRWDAAYLKDVMGGQQVNIAVTPSGNADAVVKREDGSLIFVEPYETSEAFGDFLEYVRADSDTPASEHENLVKYAQTQNDNLRSEYSSLFHDVPRDVPFARIALEKEADAINLWIGNARSVTALHKDNYENVYVQVRGRKHFVLLPPVEMPCVNEQALPRARYRPPPDCGDGRAAGMFIKEDESQDLVPVVTWDPDVPDERPSQYSSLSKPLQVTLDEGDMLYLPAMWYHKVSQSAGEEGFACAVNYWYDMDFDGGFWTANELMRDVVNSKAHAVHYPAFEYGEDE